MTIFFVVVMFYVFDIEYGLLLSYPAESIGRARLALEPLVFHVKFTEPAEIKKEADTTAILQTTISDSETKKRNFENIPRNLTWFMTPPNASKTDWWSVEVLAAFYDYRINKVVLFIASDAGSLLADKKPALYDFWCIFLYQGSDIVSQTKATFYTSYMIYCPMPDNVHRRKQHKSSDSVLIPNEVTLLRNDSMDLENLPWKIPVISLKARLANRYSNSGEPKDNAKTLAVCVGIMYRFQPWLTVLEFIEYHRWQGVEKFYFFYSSIHNSTRELFDWYEQFQPGVMELFYWNPSHYTCWDDYKCQLLRNNFCSYSLMHKYKFVGILDYDELFSPAKIDQENLTSLLYRRLDNKTTGSVTFRCKYHQLLHNDTPDWENLRMDSIGNVVQEFLPLYHHVNVSTLCSRGFSPKTIIKPETVLKMWVHYVQIHTDGTDVHVPDEKEAFLRHFKIRDWWGGWAPVGDQEVTYQIKDPFVEVGNLTLHTLNSRISDIVRRCKEYNSFKVD